MRRFSELLAPFALLSILPLILKLIDWDIVSWEVDKIARSLLLWVCSPLLALAIVSLCLPPYRNKPASYLACIVSIIFYAAGAILLYKPMFV